MGVVDRWFFGLVAPYNVRHVRDICALRDWSCRLLRHLTLRFVSIRGPGPGLTTDRLRRRTAHLTSIEIDPSLARALEGRMRGSNVTVVEGDATAMPFEDGTFSGAVSFTMLHHVPSPALQDRLLAEVRRVLRPGASFAGSDSVSSLPFRMIHLFDTMVLVDPDRFAGRLEAAGFSDVRVDRGRSAFRFCATV